VAKFQIEYELKANIGAFKKETANVVKDADKIGFALDKSLEGISKVIKGKGLTEYFAASKKSAQELRKTVAELNKELDKGADKNDSKVRSLQQSVQAGKMQYAAEVAAASQASRGETPVEANLIRARYALYDLANEARRVGTVMTGLSLAVVKVGADFQRSFVDVQRTTGLLGSELENLRKSLVGISTATSVSFGNVATLATLAAQMGIEGENVAEFSETVSKFSAVTGVTVENAAQSFGRIAQLLNVSADEYDNLASSILFAGRNSVATEAEILSVTTQIAASAEQAGFLASEAVGLGTALASLRVQPEQARGVILRLFADFDRAMAQNGKKLADYAAILGMTVEETKSLHAQGGPEFFVQLTKALGDTQAAGSDMNVVLRQIGITNTREVNVLQRLVGNHDLLVKSINDATGAYKENVDLQAQFDQVMGTVNEQLLRLKNNIEAIAAAASAGPLQILTPLLTGLNNVLEYISQNQAASTFVALVAVVGLAAGIFLLYKAALLQATATVFALRTSIQELGLTTIGTSVSMKGLLASIIQMKTGADVANLSVRGMVGSLAGASAGARAFGLAMKAIPLLAVAGFALQAVKSFIEFEDATERAKYGVSELKSEILSLESIEEFSLFKNSSALSILIDGSGVRLLSDFQNALYDFQSTASNPEAANAISYLSGGIRNLTEQQAQILRVKEALNQLIDEGEYVKASELMAEIKAQADGIGMTTTELNTIFPTYSENLNTVASGLDKIAESEAADELRDVAAAIKEDLTAALITPDKQMAGFTVATETFLQSLKDSKNGIDVFTEDGRKAFDGFEGIIDEIIEKSGTDLTQALMGSAAAIGMVEKAGGDASRQISGLVELINEKYGIELDPSAFSTLDQLRNEIANTAKVSQSARVEIQNLLSGGEYSDVFSSIFASLQSSASRVAKSAKREIRTVFDYIGELRGLFNNITELSFASEVATDGSKGGWDSVTRSVNSARKAVVDLRKEISDQATDRIELENQLDIAKRYGDINEIRRITAEIQSLDAKIIESAEELQYQQGLASLTLVGNTRAARENRAEIRARVDETKELITAYAQTVKANGKLPTASEVKAYAKRVAGDFVSQATAIGFSADELTDYTKVITGFGTAAGAVTPPNVKVTLDPVTTAIEAYLAKKKDTTVNVSGDSKDLKNQLEDLKKLYDNYVEKTQPKKKIFIIDSSDVKLYRQALERGHISPAEYNKAVYGLPLNLSGRGTAYYKKADGGYISGPGTATSDSIPAMLSNGEYVIQASAVNRYGVGFFDSLNQMKSGSAAPAAAPQIMASASSSVVYLSEQDRALLRKAIDRPISLYTTDRKIAESANSGNKELARRGSK
jgi:TP901 family phage tail tape measure protein